VHPTGFVGGREIVRDSDPFSSQLIFDSLLPLDLLLPVLRAHLLKRDCREHVHLHASAQDPDSSSRRPPPRPSTLKRPTWRYPQSRPAMTPDPGAASRTSSACLVQQSKPNSRTVDLPRPRPASSADSRADQLLISIGRLSNFASRDILPDELRFIVLESIRKSMDRLIRQRQQVGGGRPPGTSW
jgi:hypothetical protein